MLFLIKINKNINIKNIKNNISYIFFLLKCNVFIFIFIINKFFYKKQDFYAIVLYNMSIIKYFTYLVYC